MKARWFAYDDIPVNILCRLPAKILHHVKYVSKEWYSLISERSFISSQLQNKEPLSGFFFQEIFQYTLNVDVKSISYIPIETENATGVWRNVLDFLPENVVVLSSNNGLLCCRSCFPTCQPMMYVCNPLNKQWTRVECPTNLSQTSSIALVFDPLHDPIDASTDFKLVAVNSNEYEEDDNYNTEDEEDDCSFLFDIYSPKTGLWTRSKESCKCSHSFSKNKGVFVDGILFWLTDGYQILMFDPRNELSWLVMTPIPPTEFSSIPEMCIGESNNELCYVIISEDGLQLWVLQDHFASQWELKVSRPLDDLEKEYPEVLFNLSEKVASRSCEISQTWIDPLALKDGMLLLRVLSKIYLYEFDTGRMKELCVVSSLGPRSLFSPIVVPYVMSLVPLDQP